MWLRGSTGSRPREVGSRNHAQDLERGRRSVDARRVRQPVDNGVLTDAEAKQVKEYDDLRYDAILTDAFTKEYLRDPVNHKHEDKRLESRVA